MSQPCRPPYTYVPTFVPSDITCTAPSYDERRATLLITTPASNPEVPDAISGMFFRSRGFGFDTNSIAVELVPLDSTFNVYVGQTVVEHYVLDNIGVGAIQGLRELLDLNDSLVEMTPLNFDVRDTRTEEADAPSSPLPPSLPGPWGLLNIPVTYLVGGDGPPSDPALFETIRTGPQRTMYILRSTEDVNGRVVDPPATRRIRQWNGTQWISYRNAIIGGCPLDG